MMSLQPFFGLSAILRRFLGDVDSISFLYGLYDPSLWVICNLSYDELIWAHFMRRENVENAPLNDIVSEIYQHSLFACMCD